MNEEIPITITPGTGTSSPAQ